MGFTVQNVYGLLIRSRLLPLDDAKAMYDRWLTESRGAVENVELFARWMVAHHYLTEYQAMLLARGHADGFFLNQYKILDRLGRGRMAGVYKAVHSLGQVVAIKVLPPSKAQDRQLLARFQREARLSMRLKHPNVVRAFQVAWANGLHYIVMEYLDGETLDEVLQRRRKLLPGEAVRVVYQALQGLQHIHEQKLIHRDLKPSNVMLVPACRASAADTTLHSAVKILDIGLGRTFFEDVNPASSSLEDPQLTGEGVLLGTPDYLAPEQARNARAVDIRADIYSLGCMLYHCLAGQPPFPDTNIITQMIRHATETPRSLKEISPEVPEGLQQIVNRMMAKDPAQRFPTPDKAAQALQGFMAAGSETPSTPEADARLKSYLTWLEINNGAGPAPAAGAGAAPAAPTEKRSKGLVPSKRSSTRKHHRSRKHKRSKPSIALPSSPAAPAAKREAAPAATAGIDVELVPLARTRKKSRRRTAPPPNKLSRRDFIMMAIGGGGVLGAIGLGWLVALIRNRFKVPDAGPEEPESPEPEKKEPETKDAGKKDADRKATETKDAGKNEPEKKMESKDADKKDMDKKMEGKDAGKKEMEGKDAGKKEMMDKKDPEKKEMMDKKDAGKKGDD